MTEAELHGKGSAEPKLNQLIIGKEQRVVKEKWGTKRTCPKCGTRFYDLGKENPVVCIDCANEWVPEPILKSRQPQLEEIKKPEPAAKAEDKDEVEEIIKGEEGGDTNPDNDLDLDDGSDVSDVLQKPKSPEAGD